MATLPTIRPSLRSKIRDDAPGDNRLIMDSLGPAGVLLLNTAEEGRLLVGEVLRPAAAALVPALAAGRGHRSGHRVTGHTLQLLHRSQVMGDALTRRRHCTGHGTGQDGITAGHTQITHQASCVTMAKSQRH